MAEAKTKETDKNVNQFISTIENKQKQNDCFELIKIMTEITNLEPKMWGENMVGFGSYHYKYESRREGDMFLTGFSPRKQHITIYLGCTLSDYSDLLEKIGKFKASGSCFHLKKLADIDTNILKELIKISIENIKIKYK